MPERMHDRTDSQPADNQLQDSQTHISQDTDSAENTENEDTCACAQTTTAAARAGALGYRITPMFEQYLAIKAEYPDALLFYRMGDFYELFFEDAPIAARELQLALTCRNKNAPNAVPMCGVPWHAVEGYTGQLLARGYNIVICDQVEDPKLAKGLVRREVTRILTPGTVIEEEQLTAKLHNYLGSLCVDKDKAAFVWADISTGQWSGITQPLPAIWQYVAKYAPRELLVQEGLELPADAGLDLVHGLRLVRRGRLAFDLKQCTQRITRSQKVSDIRSLGMQDTVMPRAAGALLAYLEQTQKRNPDHLLPFRPLDMGRYLLVDEVTERNLEIFSTVSGNRGKGTLRSVMDATITPMGGRFLEDMLRNPLRDKEAITCIQGCVLALIKAPAVLKDLATALDGVFDLERLTTRICLNRASPKDFAGLKNTLLCLPAVHAALTELARVSAPSGTPVLLARLLASFDEMTDCADLLSKALADTMPTLITEGGIFRKGYNAELDAILDFCEHGEQLLQQQLEEDQARVGQIRLKLGNNRVFGYYYEISRLQAREGLPEDFERRQTLANAERFTTENLKTLEDNIVQAADRRCSLEYKLFQELREHVASLRPRLCAISDTLARVDYWQSLAAKAREYGWVRPELCDDPVLRIQEGRHPVIESMLGQANFVPNSLTLDQGRRLCLLTGPNMGGKSTILRQVALICLMAQMGSFVPAQSATLGIVDRLFSRVGASDNLTQGQSTFMVEMTETARILRQATRHSLIILDEIGRGTSTFDGLALAWAVAEDLAQRFGGSLRTLFATHYHELTRLEGQIPGVFTMNVAIREFNKGIIFLHKLLPGPSDKSYGVEVARLAGVPHAVVTRARDLLERLESVRQAGQKAVSQALGAGLQPGRLPGLATQDKAADKAETGKPDKAASGRKQADPAVQGCKSWQHPLVPILQDLDPESLSPLAALKLLCEWKKIWGMPGAATADTADEAEALAGSEVSQGADAQAGSNAATDVHPSS